MKRFDHVEFAGLTDMGKKRKNNEDAMGAFPSAGIFCVADGMGGGDDGEIASAAVVRAVEEIAKKSVPPDDGGYAAADVADVVERALDKASKWILDMSEEKNLKGCGSTFVGVVLDATRPDSALAVHAGDSRLYLLHGRSISQITRDHSAAEMIGAKDESSINPMFRSMVMNAVGIHKTVDAERTPFKIEAGDRILICSDGLSRMVPDKKILAISRENANIDDAVRALISAALEAGGVDNVTVILIEIGPLPQPVKGVPIPSDEPSPGGRAGKGEHDPDDDDPKTLQTLQMNSTLKTMQADSTQQTIMMDSSTQTLATLLPEKMDMIIGRSRTGGGHTDAAAQSIALPADPGKTPRRIPRAWIVCAAGIAAAAAIAAIAMLVATGKSGGTAANGTPQQTTASGAPGR